MIYINTSTTFVAIPRLDDGAIAQITFVNQLTQKRFDVPVEDMSKNGSQYKVNISSYIDYFENGQYDYYAKDTKGNVLITGIAQFGEFVPGTSSYEVSADIQQYTPDDSYQPAIKSTLRINENGTYDVVRYDEAIVEVEKGKVSSYWLMSRNYGIPNISLSDVTSTFEIEFRLRSNTNGQTIFDDGYTSLIYDDDQYKARLNGGEWTETFVRENDVKERTVKLTGTKLQIDYYVFDLIDGGHKWDYNRLYIGGKDSVIVGDIDLFHIRYIFDNGNVASDYRPNVVNGASVFLDEINNNEMVIKAIPPVPTQEKEVTITANGQTAVTPDDGYDLSKVTINVDTPEPKEEETKAVTINDNTLTVIEPEDGKVLSRVEVTTTVPQSDPYGFSDIGYTVNNPAIIKQWVDAAKTIEEDWNNKEDKTNLDYFLNYRKDVFLFPNIDTSNVVSASNAFQDSSIGVFPTLDFDNLENAYWMFAYSKVQQLPATRFPKVTNASDMFSNTQLTKVPDLYLPEATNTSSILVGTQQAEEVGDIYIPKSNELGALLGWSYNVHKVGKIHLNGVANMTELFPSTDGIQELGGFPGLGESFIDDNQSLVLSNSSGLTNESIQNIIDTIYDLTQNGHTATITLHSDVFNNVTDAQKEQATAKGWTIASA